MSSLWSRLEELKAKGWDGAQARRHRCNCGKCSPAGWTLDPKAAQEVSPGFPRYFGFDPVLHILSKVLPRHLAQPGVPGDPAYLQGAFQTEHPTLVAIFDDVLRLADSYTLPLDAQKEKSRFAWQIWDLLCRIVQNNSHPHVSWPDFVTLMEEELGTNDWNMEKLVRHHDPRLQLIHLPSFRFFVELQLYQHHFRLRVSEFMGRKGDSITGMLRVYASVAVVSELIVFYAKELRLLMPRGFVCTCPPSAHQDLLFRQMLPSAKRPRKPEAAAEAQAVAGASGDFTPAVAFEEPPLVPAKERLSKGQRKRRARAAAKASRTAADARARSPSADSSEGPDDQSKEEPSLDGKAGSEPIDSDWALTHSGQPPCPPRESASGGAAKETPKSHSQKAEAPSGELVKAEFSSEAEGAASAGESSKSAASTDGVWSCGRKPVSPVAPVVVKAPSWDWALLARDHARLLRRLRATPRR